MLASVLGIRGEGWLTIQTPRRFAQANDEKSCFRSNMQRVDIHIYTEDRDLANQSM